MTNYPTPYRPAAPPTIPGGDRMFFLEEFTKLRRTLAEVQDMLPEKTNAAPGRPREGMVRKALSPWRPVVGQTTDKWVIYNGSAWEYLDV